MTTHWRYRLARQLVFLRQLFWQAYRERFLVSFVSTFIFASIIAILNRMFYDSGVWDGFEIDPDMSHWFCEYTDMKKFVRQPINTFTNFVYLVYGMYFFSKGLGDIKKKRSYNLITANHFYSFVLAIIMFYTFICSSFFHSSLIETASNMDFSAVYSLTLFPLMYFTHRAILLFRNKPTDIKHWNERLMMIIIFGSIYILLTFFISMHYVHPIVGSIILAIIILGIYLEKKDKGKTNKDYLIATIVSILTAIVFFQLDIKKILCNPHSFINPHALWHLFNGTAVFFFYLYIRSEHYKPEFDDLRSNIRKELESNWKGKSQK